MGWCEGQRRQGVGGGLFNTESAERTEENYRWKICARDPADPATRSQHVFRSHTTRRPFSHRLPDSLIGRLRVTSLEFRYSARRCVAVLWRHLLRLPVPTRLAAADTASAAAGSADLLPTPTPDCADRRKSTVFVGGSAADRRRARRSLVPPVQTNTRLYREAGVPSA